MKRASQDNGIIIDNHKFIGIALGYDYCAEHEWGIKDLGRKCGIPDPNKKNMGVKNRTITKTPPFVFKEEKHKKRKFAILFTGCEWKTQEENNNSLPYEFENWKEKLIRNEEWNKNHSKNNDEKDNIITAWDGENFGVAVMGEKEVEWLKELKENIEKKNLTIAVANLRVKNPFAGSSLCLLITDRIPQETLDLMYYGDKEYYDREDYEKKIGMKKIIKKYGNKDGYKGAKYFMACSPKWIDYNDDKNRDEQKKKYNTKYDILYWVNYSDNDDNYGWYTVEEIREWLKGKKKLIEIRKAK